MDANYYIYCITSPLPEGINIGITGMDGEKVFAIYYKDICALVSKSMKTSCEPNLENLRCHEKVAASAMEFCSVLPLSFSTICRDEDSIRTLLEKYYNQFKENLAKIQGKVELGIKIFYKFNFEEENKQDKTQCLDPKEYMKRKYGIYQERKKQMESITKAADEIHSILSNMAHESIYEKPFKNNLVFNGAYLVGKEDIEKFSKRVAEIRPRHSEYKIIYSGPWCPYHFVTLIKEGVENA
jgi:hypothetical protein